MHLLKMFNPLRLELVRKSWKCESLFSAPEARMKCVVAVTPSVKDTIVLGSRQALD